MAKESTKGLGPVMVLSEYGAEKKILPHLQMESKVEQNDW